MGLLCKQMERTGLDNDAKSESWGIPRTFLRRGTRPMVWSTGQISD